MSAAETGGVENPWMRSAAQAAIARLHIWSVTFIFKAPAALV
jgi:hypothetical protein